MTAELPGLDLVRLRAFLDQARPGLVAGELRGELIAGGRSNLTYDVTDGRTAWVFRRPPLGHVLATAHDMGREFRVMTALAPTDVPVPQTVVLCEDPEVLGAPFYLMAKVDGTPYRLARELEPLGPERTRQICLRMVDTLAALHRVDPAAVGLTEFGRPDGYLNRQVRRWGKQLAASRSRELAGIDELHAELERRVPEQSPTAIVHGDYRLDNLLVDASDQVAAVLDWEMSTLGDPLTDIALLASYEDMAQLPGTESVADVVHAPGYLGKDEMLARYAGQSGRDLSALPFYVGLGFFKMAVVLEGIHFRFTQGKTVGAGFERLGGIVEPLVALGLAALEES